MSNKDEDDRFSGDEFDPKFDGKRLAGQILRVFDVVSDGRWRTLDELARETGDPHASVSAQLRNLRKQDFGSHTIIKRHRGDRANGLWEYSYVADVSIVW